LAISPSVSRSPPLSANGEVAGDPVELFRRNQWSDLSVRIAAVADPQCLAERLHARGELVVDFALDEQAGARAADLPRIGENRHACARHRCIEIGVRKYHVGRFAPELQRHTLEVTGRCLDDLLAGEMRSGERDLVNIGMARQRRAGGFAVARNHIDGTGRKIQPDAAA
jgi:hypothetical protein